MLKLIEAHKRDDGLREKRAKRKRKASLNYMSATKKNRKRELLYMFNILQRQRQKESVKVSQLKSKITPEKAKNSQKVTF